MAAGRPALDGASRSAVRVGLLGCGTVGGALVEIVALDGAGIATRAGIKLDITRIAVQEVDKPRSEFIPADLLTKDAESVATDPDVDVVVELIGGIEPARSLILDKM